MIMLSTYTNKLLTPHELNFNEQSMITLALSKPYT